MMWRTLLLVGCAVCLLIGGGLLVHRLQQLPDTTLVATCEGESRTVDFTVNGQHRGSTPYTGPLRVGDVIDFETPAGCWGEYHLTLNLPEDLGQTFLAAYRAPPDLNDLPSFLNYLDPASPPVSPAH